MPKTTSAWRTVSAARKEAARWWGDLVERQHRLRRRRLQWPRKPRWQHWAQGRYPGLRAHSAPQIMGACCEAVPSTRQLRKNGHEAARDPWQKPRYRHVVYPNQAARLRPAHLLWPDGTRGRLRLPIPVALPGRRLEG